MNKLVEYGDSSDEEDQQEHASIEAAPSGSAAAAEAPQESTFSPPILSQNIPPEFARLCELKRADPSFSFLESCKATTQFRLPDLVDQLALETGIRATATQLPSQVFVGQWPAGAEHPGKAMVEELDARAVAEPK